MQLVLGIIIGILLTIGTAFVLDSGRSPVCPAGGIGCPIVNWDEADTRFHHAKEGVESAWHRLVHS